MAFEPYVAIKGSPRGGRGRRASGCALQSIIKGTQRRLRLAPDVQRAMGWSVGQPVLRHFGEGRDNGKLLLVPVASDTQGRVLLSYQSSDSRHNLFIMLPVATVGAGPNQDLRWERHPDGLLIHLPATDQADT